MWLHQEAKLALFQWGRSSIGDKTIQDLVETVHEEVLKLGQKAVTVRLTEMGEMTKAYPGYLARFL